MKKVLVQNQHKANQRKAKEKPKKIEDKILQLIKDMPEITVAQISENLNRTLNSTRYYLRKMSDQGIIRHEGPTKSGKWIIIKDSITHSTTQANSHISQK